jgi:hypothetical protein
VTGRKKKRRGACWAGGGASWAAWAGSARARGRKMSAACFASGREKKKKKRAGWAKRRKGKGEKGFRVSLFLKKILFKFVFSNFQTSLKQETTHSNDDAQELIISNFI